MGRIFIENENEIDLNKHYYCFNCKKYLNELIEISSVNRCTSVECETVNGKCLVFLDISYKNIYFNKSFKKFSIHPNTTNTFVILDTDPITADSVADEICCVYCRDILGWIILYHPTHEGYCFIKKEKVF